VIEAEHVGEEDAIGIGVEAEQDEVRPEDHVHMLPAVERSCFRGLASRWTDSMARESCTGSGTGNDGTRSAELPYGTMYVSCRRFVGT
jgi:hypothetical protein